jgi:hypothetical protein
MNTNQAKKFVFKLSQLLADESNYESELMPKLQQLQDHLTERASKTKSTKREDES